jgi:hypothetical protein
MGKHEATGSVNKVIRIKWWFYGFEGDYRSEILLHLI